MDRCFVSHRNQETTNLINYRAKVKPMTEFGKSDHHIDDFITRIKKDERQGKNVTIEL
jgi:hypothetical protein